MKSAIKFSSAAAALFFALSGAAHAGLAINVPEPGSLALVGLAVGALVVVARKRK